MKDIEDETIDKSCWIPDDEEPPMTAERARAIGLVVEYDEDGSIMFGKADRHANVMKFLYAEKFIDDQEYFDGNEYILWRQLFRVFCCGEARQSYGEKGVQGGEGTRERGFFLLINRLPKHHHEVIEYAVDQNVMSSAGKLAIRMQSKRFASAFYALSHHIQIIRGEIAPPKKDA